ncbi:MAG TPA: hypothetical protein VFB54_19180 [Burkholderiales bacterium]|nr:hypothetical protein [Burkholderiales bacterium]
MRVALTAHVGFLVTGHNRSGRTRYHHTNRGDAQLGVAWDFGYAVAQASVVGASRDDGFCRTQRGRCAPGVVFALRKEF